MFDSLESRAEGLGPAGILQAARGVHRRRIAIENEQLVLAVAWADANPAESIHPDQLALTGGPRGVRPGGEGTPEVNDLAIVTYGAAVQKSHGAARLFLGQALDLRHRHPLLWGKLMRCEVIAWQGCQVAQLTHDLNLVQARWVDEQVARFAGVVPWPKLRDRVEAAIMKIDADRIEQHAKDRRSRLGVWLTQPDDDGLRGIYGRLEPSDAIRLFGRIQDLADCLPGNCGTADQRRATAFAMLGNELQATKVMARHRQPDLFEQELALAVQPVEGEPEEPIEESDIHPALRDRPLVPDFDHAVFQAAVERLVDGLDPDRLLPTTTLVVHLAAESLDDGHGICRVPGIGPTTMGVVKQWLGHHRVKVRPVIDLNDPPPPVDSYEIPDRHKRLVHLRHPASTFPWSTATNALDLDHVLPYLSRKRGGPSGQTRVDGLTPNARTEHRAVTHGGWQKRTPDLGTMIYRDPYGDVYLTNHTGTHDLGDGPFADAIWALAQPSRSLGLVP